MYTEKKFKLPEMDGISAKQVDIHLKLYSGYVKNVNEMIEAQSKYNTDPESNSIAIAEIRRRFPFEWNGMRLHEYYFEALGGNGEIRGESSNLISDQFGSVDAWQAEFKKIGITRGIGWVLLALDMVHGKLFNIWVSDHEIGNLAGCKIILAMDMWEHAFMVDYIPSEKGSYIDAYFKNLNWDIVSSRINKAKQ